jgi:hypothetical protein
MHERWMEREKFEDIKGINWSRKSKVKQNNGQKKRIKINQAMVHQILHRKLQLSNTNQTKSERKSLKKLQG